MINKTNKGIKKMSKKMRSFEGEHISKGLLSVLVFSFVSYMYLVGMAGMNTVSRSENDKEVRTLRTEVSTMELTYIDATRSYTLSKAVEEGYTETKNISFATRVPNVAYIPSTHGI